MKVAVTGATGLIGSRLVEMLRRRGDEVVVLSRDPAAAERQLGVPATAWQPERESAPTSALEAVEAVVHLAGEPIAQRWTEKVRRRISDSRVQGTANLVAGIEAAQDRPAAVISSSAVGYYGPHGDEQLDESAAPGSNFLATLCVKWERAAAEVERLGVRRVSIRTGVVLSGAGGALKRMLPPFKLGLGGRIGSGRQYIPWIHIDDLVGIMITAARDARWTGPVNATAPEPVTNREFTRELGRVLGRPTFLPVPTLALRVLYGEMAQVITTGQRAVPRRVLELGYSFRYETVADALSSILRS